MSIVSAASRLRPYPGGAYFPAIVLLVGTGIAAFAVYGPPWSPFRQLASTVFLLVGPGLAIVPLLHLRGFFPVWTLSVATSLALSGILSLVMAYAHLWMPRLGFSVMLLITVLGAAAQLNEVRHGKLRKVEP